MNACGDADVTAPLCFARIVPKIVKGASVMEMSVKAGGAAVTVEQPKNRPSTDRRNSSDDEAGSKRIFNHITPGYFFGHANFLRAKKYKENCCACQLNPDYIKETQRHPVLFPSRERRISYRATISAMRYRTASGSVGNEGKHIAAVKR